VAAVTDLDLTEEQIDALMAEARQVEVNGLVVSLMYARLAHGLTQAQLADRLGVSRAAVESWETGRREPRASRLVDWVDALGLRLHLAPKEEP